MRPGYSCERWRARARADLQLYRDGWMDRGALKLGGDEVRAVVRVDAEQGPEMA